MRQTTIWTAAAATLATFVTADAHATLKTYGLEFRPQSQLDTSFGSGHFTIDDSILTPSTTITNPAIVLDFEATFTGAFGNPSFDESDLDAINLKVSASGGIDSVSFGTVGNGPGPNLDSGAANVTMLIDSDGDPRTFDPFRVYSTFIVSETTAVPEPGTLALLAAGAAALPLIRRRRAQKAA